MSTPNTALVEKHRAKMAKAGYARMEVTLGLGLIKLARARATQRRCPLWQVVQDALIVATGTAAAGKAAQIDNGDKPCE